MRSTFSRLVGAAMLAVIFVSSGRSEQQAPRQAAADWPMYRRDHAGTGYSPLAQINPKNVATMSGSDFNARPFNLATNGHRQPGSSFKPFILARALDDGIDPNSVWTSAPQRIPFKGKKGPEIFEANNYENSYLGSATRSSPSSA